MLENVRGPPRPPSTPPLAPRTCGTYKTVKARFWPWPSGKSPYNLTSCSLFARKRTGNLRIWLALVDHLVGIFVFERMREREREIESERKRERE